MNKTEQLGYKWLKKQGYKSKDIKFNVNKSPDFVCSNGKRYEIKTLDKYKGIFFQTSQIKQLRDNDIILVFDKNRLLKTFFWENIKKQGFKLYIQNNEDRTSISLSNEIILALKELRKYKKESYGEIISRLFKK